GWPDLAAADGLLVQDEQQVLSPGALLAALLAVASVAVLAGGRMAEHTRRTGLLKAAGGGPGLVAGVLLAENLVLALAAAAAGLGRPDRGIPPPARAAAARAAAGRPPDAPRNTRRGQHHDHGGRGRRRPGIPRHCRSRRAGDGEAERPRGHQGRADAAGAHG